jgi:hypothetical protein
MSDDENFEDYLEEQQAETIFSGADALAGEWQIVDNGDMEGFLETIGMSWIKRKAANVAQAAGMTTQKYVITVEGDTITINTGKRSNTFKTDGSEFTYDGPTG